MKVDPFRAAAMALALLPVALFAEAVAGRSVLFERDVHSYWVPGITAFVRAIAEGAWPLWDPLTNFGRPLLADPNLQFAYPPTWLNLVLPPGAYITLFVVCHCAWGGLGVLLLARAWGLGAVGASWAAASWMLSGPFLSTAILIHHFPSAAWMGWVLLALERVIERPGAAIRGLAGVRGDRHGPVRLRGHLRHDRGGGVGPRRLCGRDPRLAPPK